MLFLGTEQFFMIFFVHSFVMTDKKYFGQVIVLSAMLFESYLECSDRPTVVTRFFEREQKSKRKASTMCQN